MEQTLKFNGNVVWSLIFYIFAVLLVCCFINKIIGPKTIKNLPVVYTPFPILNGLKIIVPKAKNWLETPCLKFYNLSKTYGEVYQIKFGSKLIVVANSYDSIKELWCSRNTKGNNSRPVGYSFHKVLSKGVYTVGTTPMGDSYKRARKHISERVLSQKCNNDFNYKIMDKACNKLIDRLIINSNTSTNIISNEFIKEAQYYHLKIALWLTYGFDFDPDQLDHRNLGDEIIIVENKITKVRSHIQNIQDYLPAFVRFILNLFSNQKVEFQQLYEIRGKYLQNFHDYTNELYKNINNIELSKDFENIEDLKRSLMYTYFDNNNKNITVQDVTSECLTMVSAGLDNTPLNFKYGLHQLINYHPEMWDKAYYEITQLYNGDTEMAFNECASQMNSNYIIAIVKETLRMYTVLPLALPRETTKDTVYKDAIIPKGTTLFMNCWAGNHDEKKFISPMEFEPERWLVDIVDESGSKDEVLNPNMNHLAFGIGSRMCLGNHLAMRELYILFCKIILKFEPITRDCCALKNLPENPLQLNMYPESLAIEPIPFDIVLHIRDTT